MSTAKQTHNHSTIKSWVEKHNGVPSIIKNTSNNKGTGLLRIHFPEHSKDNDSFEEIEWDAFFKEFDDQKLSFLYEDKDDSTFHKFVDRE